MDFLRIIGRYLFAIPFMIFGIIHFVNAQEMAQMLPGWMPGGVFWIILTGLGFLAAGLSIIIRIWDRLAGILLGIMLLIFILTIHLPNMMSDPLVAMGNLLRDTALAGAAWIYAGYIGKSDAPLTITK